MEEKMKAIIDESYKRLKMISATVEALPDGWEAEATQYPIDAELSRWAKSRISIRELKKICDRLVKEAKDER